MNCKKCGSEKLTYRPSSNEFYTNIPIKQYENTVVKTMYCIDCGYINIYEESLDAD